MGIEIGGELVALERVDLVLLTAGIRRSKTGGFSSGFVVVCTTVVLRGFRPAKKGNRPVVVGRYWCWSEVRPTAVRTGHVTPAKPGPRVAVTEVTATRPVWEPSPDDDGDEQGDCEDDADDDCDAEQSECDERVYDWKPRLWQPAIMSLFGWGLPTPRRVRTPVPLTGLGQNETTSPEGELVDSSGSIRRLRGSRLECRAGAVADGQLMPDGDDGDRRGDTRPRGGSTAESRSGWNRHRSVAVWLVVMQSPLAVAVTLPSEGSPAWR